MNHLPSPSHHCHNGYLTLVILLLLGLAHGLIYVFIIPPWQHYDEPNHFEYAWLVVHRSGLPKIGDHDPGLDRQLVKSMLDNGFYKGSDYQPDLSSPNQDVSPGGYSQLYEKPYYYLLVSLPLRFFNFSDLVAQLHAMRVFNLVFYLLSILSAWGMMRELAAPSNPLRWMVPLTLVMFPGFIDSMSGLNNGAIAVAIVSLFLWGSVRLLRRGPTWVNVSWVAATALLSYFTKNTAYIAIPLSFFVFLFGFLRGRWRRAAWAILLIASLVLLSVSLSLNGVALWYRSTAQKGPVRVTSQSAVHGSYVFRLESQAEVTPGWFVPLFQPLPLHEVAGLRGKTITLGVWMWASQPVKARLPVLYTDSQSFSQTVSLSDKPAFFAFKAKIPRDVNRIWVSITPRVSLADVNVKLFYDGLVLAQGERPLQQVPQFSDRYGEKGDWGKEPFTNLLRNASAERAGLRFRSWADNLGAKILPDKTRPSLILTSLLDIPGAGWFYKSSGVRLLRTFWGMFAWGQVPLLGHNTYRILGFVTLIGFMGAVVAVWRKRNSMHWPIVLLMGLVLAGTWGSTLARGPIYLGVSHLYLPVARYAFTAMIPTILILDLGWLEILRLVDVWPNFLTKRTGEDRQFGQNALRYVGRNPALFSGLYLSDSAALIVFPLLFLLLDVLSIISILRYYSG